MANNNIFCIDVNKLPEFAMIAGDAELLRFEYFYPDGNPYDLEAAEATAKWSLCRMGRPDNMLVQKDGEIFDGNKFVVQLTTEDTQNLSGKFLQQPKIIDKNGREYVFQQGIITIIPKIR